MSDDEAAGPVPGPTDPVLGAPDPTLRTEVTTVVPPDGDGSGPAAREERDGKHGSFWRELPVLLVIALALALLIKAFLVQAFYIPSGSMENTLRIDDRVLVNKLVYDFRDIKRGEIVVFDANGSLAPDSDARVIQEPANPVSKVLNKVSTTLGFGVPPGEQDYIKRVIGVAGDRVMCCDANDRIVVTPKGKTVGVALDEPYVFENSNPQRFCAAGASEPACPPDSEGVLVPEGRLFVMGDHRSESSDSRLKYVRYFQGEQNDGNNGTVSEDLVIGRAFVTVWPLGHLDWLSVPDLFGQEVDDGAAAPYALGAVGVAPLAWLRHRRRRRRRTAPA